MRAKLLFLLVALTVAAGCAGTQIREPAPEAAAAILVTTLALIVDEDATYKRREYEPGEWTYCDVGCKFRQHLAREREATARLQRRQENERLRAEFDAFMTNLEDTDQVSGQPSLSVIRSDRPFDP